MPPLTDKLNPEDPASVLEQFIYSASNLPAEVNHLYQEIEANDKLIQNYKTEIFELDSSIQKAVKANGVSQKAPREDASTKTIFENYAKCMELQDENVVLSERAQMLLEKHIRKLDKKINDLQADGSMPVDHQLPSLLRDSPANLVPLPGQREAEKKSGLNRAGSHTRPSRAIGAIPGGPSLTQQAQTVLEGTIGGGSRRRDSSITDGKRRRAGILAGTKPGTSGQQIYLSGRQPSQGPGSSGGTPRASAPNSRSSSAVPSAIRPGKKAGATKRGNGSLPFSEKAASPSIGLQTAPTRRRGKGAIVNGKLGRRGTKASPPPGSGGGGGSVLGDDDSFMSELEPSDDDSNINDSSILNSKLGLHSDRMEIDDEEGDDTKYCICDSVSFGNMVMCDNANCQYQWFHWACIGMDKEPEGDWLCPKCVKLSPGKVRKVQ